MNDNLKNKLKTLLLMVLICIFLLIIILGIQTMAVGGEPIEIQTAKVVHLQYNEGRDRTPSSYYVTLEVDTSFYESGQVLLKIFGRDYAQLKVDDEISVTKWKLFKFYETIRLGDAKNPNRVIHIEEYLTKNK